MNVDDEFLAAPFADLTTTGRRSGLPRTVEIWFAGTAETVYILAGGRERAHWVRNMIARPRVRFRVREVTLDGTGRVVSDPDESEHARDLLVAKYQPTCQEDLSDWRRTSLPVAIDFETRLG